MERFIAMVEAKPKIDTIGKKLHAMQMHDDLIKFLLGSGLSLVTDSLCSEVIVKARIHLETLVESMIQKYTVDRAQPLQTEGATAILNLCPSWYTSTKV